MSIPTSLRDVYIGANAAGGDYQIEHSLKFNSDANQYLYHDLSGTPSGTTHGSLSCWIKSKLGPVSAALAPIKTSRREVGILISRQCQC